MLCLDDTADDGVEGRDQRLAALAGDLNAGGGVEVEEPGLAVEDRLSGAEVPLGGSFGVEVAALGDMLAEELLAGCQ
ncbi:MAG TPA: hypothetical protein VFE62_10715 [Gemmataceae bacterium]|nr:hypothetical protein [Gemmataceae bacterium]